MFTNRFYYSAQQKAAQLACGHDGHCFIVLSTGKEVEYTEWCSSPESKCNWDDARLVYASDNVPNIHHIMGPEEKEDWDRLMKEGFDFDTEVWDDLDEPDDMSAEFEAYERAALEAWEKWMDNRPGPEEDYVRGEQFNQDT